MSKLRNGSTLGLVLHEPPTTAAQVEDRSLPRTAPISPSCATNMAIGQQPTTTPFHQIIHRPETSNPHLTAGTVQRQRAQAILMNHRHHHQQETNAVTDSSSEDHTSTATITNTLQRLPSSNSSSLSSSPVCNGTPQQQDQESAVYRAAQTQIHFPNLQPNSVPRHQHQKQEQQHLLLVQPQQQQQLLMTQHRIVHQQQQKAAAVSEQNQQCQKPPTSQVRTYPHQQLLVQEQRDLKVQHPSKVVRWKDIDRSQLHDEEASVSSSSSSSSCSTSLLDEDGDEEISSQNEVLPQHHADNLKALDDNNSVYGQDNETIVQSKIRQRIHDMLRHAMSPPTATTNSRLLMMNLSRRNLEWEDAYMIQKIMHQHPHLSVLKLSYNQLGDRGAAIIACGFLALQQLASINAPAQLLGNDAGNHKTTPTFPTRTMVPDGKRVASAQNQNRHHPSLALLDLGFNGITDAGCAALALHAVAGNAQLRTLYLSGNFVQQQGAMALAAAILQPGSSLSSLHLSVNSIGPVGVEALARAIAEREAKCFGIETSAPQRTEQPQQQTAVASSAPQTREKTMQEMYLVGTEMGARGCVTLSSMLLTNFSIRVLSLAQNGIDDNTTALLAQSLARNKTVPLEVLNLSFNEITCVGVECLMNAVWGSRTLREIRMDNNKIRDRGAQLTAVVLTSIQLQVIDLSFNKVTTVGIKALMKSLSESSSLFTLGLSGISIDPNGSKAMSYGLAYNPSLKYLHVDNCQIGYSAQRHIVAGIISNRNASLRVITGFSIGAICVTLGLPQVLEGWTNDQCLSFVRLMWKQWREENGISNDLTISSGGRKSVGPAPPAAVVRAAEMALTIVGHDSSSLNTEPHQKEVSETSPLVQTNAFMLERTMSGTIKIPDFAQAANDDIEEWSTKSPHAQQQQQQQQQKTAHCAATSAPVGPSVDPAQKHRNLLWLRKHFQSLHEVARLPFNHADLWQLHQYFFSPLTPSESVDKKSSQNTAEEREDNAPISPPPPVQPPPHNLRAKTPQSSPLPQNMIQKSSSLSRALSFQMLGEAVSTECIIQSAASRLNGIQNNRNRRRALDAMENGKHQYDCDSTDGGSESEPATKRAKNFKPRIAYYPRIRKMLENMGDKPQHQILSLLRQLKLVESIVFAGRNVYSDTDTIRQPNELSPLDVEMIIVDLL